MISAREQKKEAGALVSPLKSRKNEARPAFNPCGGCNSCHGFTAVRSTSNQPVFGGNGEAGVGPDLQRPCATTFFQRNLGNSFMQSASGGDGAKGGGPPTIQRKCSCGGSCSGCSDEEELKRVQPKLALGPATDVYEQEADRVAEQVMRMPGPLVETGDDQPYKGMDIQRMAKDGGARGSTADINLDRGAGRPLFPSTRKFMEPRFGADFGSVRVHTGQKAHNSASEIHARAFTYGNDIWLGKGESEGDKSLMAHELTHVVQQVPFRTRPESTRIQRQLLPPIPIVVQPSTFIEVNAVDARQETGTSWYKPWRYMGPITNFFRGDVTMTSIADMVSNVIAFLRGRRMDRLNIIDHGNAHGVQIGSDWLSTPRDVSRYRGDLARLSPSFASGAFVHMQNCHAGQNNGLICALAQSFGTPVYAGTGLHNPLLGFNLGDYVRCEPNGTFNPDSGRPQTPHHEAPLERYGLGPPRTRA